MIVISISNHGSRTDGHLLKEVRLFGTVSRFLGSKVKVRTRLLVLQIKAEYIWRNPVSNGSLVFISVTLFSYCVPIVVGYHCGTFLAENNSKSKFLCLKRFCCKIHESLVQLSTVSLQSHSDFCFAPLSECIFIWW